MPDPSPVVSEVAKKLTTILLAALCLQGSIVGAQTNQGFPGISLNAKTLRVQEQAEEVYQRTDYKRAFFIYRNELAPIGDKYAQYMVGFMFLTGKGVDEDRVMASAWYRLAAERGTKEFVRERDKLMRTLDAQQTARSDQLFVELRKEHGDLIVLMNALRKDYEALQARTGSRLSSDSSPIAVIDLNRPTGSGSGTEYYGRIERRIKARLAYISQHTQIEITDERTDSVSIDLIEAQVSQHLETLD